MRTLAALLTLLLVAPCAARPSRPKAAAARVKAAPAAPEVPTVASVSAALRSRFGTAARRRAALGVLELEPYPVLIFHEQFTFETLWFAIRLYDRADYRFQRPSGVALTLDEGGLAPLDMHRAYEQIEPSLALADSGSGPIVVSVSCPQFPPAYRNRPRVPRPPEAFPPDVLVGRLDRDGRVVPVIDLPSIQAGWRYGFDPFSGRVMRVHAGRFFGPPDGASGVSRTCTGEELVIRDPEGRKLSGARVAVAYLPHEPEGVLVVEHGGLRIPIGTSGPRERALTYDLLAQPGLPVSTHRVQFAVQAFRAQGVNLEPDGIRLLPRALPEFRAW